MLDRRPIVWITVCWVLGTGMACLMQGLNLLIGCAGILLVAWPLVLFYRWSSFQMALICSIALIVSALYYTWTDSRNVSPLLVHSKLEASVLNGKEVKLEGTIDSPVELDGDRADFNLAVRQAQLGGSNAAMQLSETFKIMIRLTAKDQLQTAKTWKRGDAVKLRGELKEPTAARNFGGFNYREFLRKKNIHWQVSVKGISTLDVKPPDGWGVQRFLRWNDGLRDQVGGKLDELFAPVHAGYIKGLIIGDRGDLDPEKFQSFSKLGLTHILAISGMHVGVYVTCFLWLFRICRLSKETSLLLVIILLPCYVLSTGASPSVIRAGIMAMIALYALRRNLLKDGLHILCIAALLMLFWNPYYVNDVSFQLSFIVTAGLILWVPKIQSMLPIRSKMLASTISVTCVAQWVSFPLTIFYFNQVSWLSFPANLLLVPFISFTVLPLGSISLVLGFIHPSLALWIVWLIERLNDITFHVVSWLNTPDAFVLLWPKPPIWWVLLYYAFFGLTVYLCIRFMHEQHAQNIRSADGSDDTVPLSQSHASILQGSKSLAGLPGFPLRKVIPLMIVFSLWGVQLGYGYEPRAMDRDGLIQFIDVGQGDSILIRTPEGKHLLVDGGGTVAFRKKGEEWKIRKDPYEVGQKLLVPLLKQRGVHKLDAVILTHADQDHSGGLQAVLEQIPVHAFIFNGTLKDNPGIKKLFQTALHKNIALYQADNHLQLQIDKVTALQFLYPLAEPNETPHVSMLKEQNDRSVVFRMRMYQSTFLFTGDMEQKIERELLSQLTTAPMEKNADSAQIDVLKVAHHGSKTSSTEAWLQYWKPKSSVISVGERNLYGHPSPIVLQRLQEIESAIFRTDLHGEIQMKVDGKGISFRKRL